MSSSSIPQVPFGAGQTVGKVGFGLMQLTWSPEPASDEDAFAAMKAAVDAGATVWSSATFYGQPGTPYANVKLIRRFFDKYPDYSRKVTLAIKGGITPDLQAKKGDELRELVQSEIAEINGILGKERGIDVYVLARLHPEAEVEDVMRTLKTFKDEGHFGAVGVSEMKAETVERASKIIDIACLEIEVSLWSYDDTIRSALSFCTANNIPVLAYSPLGRGFITRKWTKPEDIPEGSFQRHVPRFQGEAFYKNLELVDRLDEVAEKKGVSTSALALAWVAGLNEVTIPIPGSSKPARVRENTQAGSIKLSEDELKGVNDILASFEVAGGRYPDQASAVLMR